MISDCFAYLLRCILNPDALVVRARNVPHDSFFSEIRRNRLQK